MKRLAVFSSRILLVLSVLLMFVLAACGGSNSSDPSPADGSGQPEASGTSQDLTAGDKVYELTFALFQPEVSTISKANIAFAKEIESRSNGRVKITIHAGGSLLNAVSMYQGVIDGIADMGNSTSMYDPGAFPVTSIGELPCSVQSGWAGSNALYDLMNEYQPKEWEDVHLLTTVSTASDFLTIGLTKKTIETKEDWAGVSVRSMDSDIVSAMGGSAKDLPMAELYDALNKGVLDAYMGSFEPYKSWKLAEVCNWVTANPAPVQFSTMWYNIMNKKTWEALPEDIQKIFTEVSEEYSGLIGLAWDDECVVGAQSLIDLGKTIYVIPDNEADRWAAIVGPVVEKRLAAVASRSGMTAEEVDEIWGFFQDRVNYWNDQQAANGVKPIMERVMEVIGHDD